MELSGTEKRTSLEPTNAERSLRDLLDERGPSEREARVEFNRRLALPAACLAFAFVALPVGSRPRRGGRSSGMLTAVGIVCGYYFIFTVGAGLARGGSIPIWAGIWSANLAMGLTGVLLLPKIEQMYEEGRLSQSFAKLTDFSQWSVVRRMVVARADTENNRETLSAAAEPGGGKGVTGSAPAAGSFRRTAKGGGFPQFLDFYLLRNFLFYFALLLVAFILLFEVFTFFDLLERHRAAPYRNDRGCELLSDICAATCFTSSLRWLAWWQFW